MKKQLTNIKSIITYIYICFFVLARPLLLIILLHSSILVYANTVSSQEIYFSPNTSLHERQQALVKLHRVQAHFKQFPRLTKDFKFPWSLYFIEKNKNFFARTHVDLFSPNPQRPLRIIIFDIYDFLNKEPLSEYVHELYHLYHYEKMPETDWHKRVENKFIQEGFALLGEYLSTRYLPSSVLSGYDFNNLSLWDMKAQPYSYSQVFLFFLFIYQNCGGEDFFQKVSSLNVNDNGISYLQKVLHSLRTPSSMCKDLKALFTQFHIAHIQQNNLDTKEHIITGNHSLSPTVRAEESKSWSGQYYKSNHSNECERKSDILINDLCLRITF